MNRKLSGAERTVWLVDRADAVNSAAVVRIAAPVQEQVLRIALNWLQKRHTMLRTRVDIVGGRLPVPPGVETVPPITLRIERRLSNDHWQTEAQVEMALDIPSTRQPLVSVVLLKSPDVSEIILTLHHVLNDTATVLYLMRDLLGLLAQLMKGSHIPSLQAYPERRALDHLPSGNAKLMSSLMQTTALMVTQVTNVILQGPQKSVKRSPSRRTLPKQGSSRRGDGLYQKNSTRLLHYALSAEETARLIARCQAEGATTHGAVVAAAFQAAHQYAEQVAQETEFACTFTCLSASHLHGPLAGSGAMEIGLFVPVAMHACPCNLSASFWNIARPAGLSAFAADMQQLPLVTAALPHRMLRYLRPAHAGAILLTGLADAYAGAGGPYSAGRSPVGASLSDSFGIVINRLSGRLVLSFFYPAVELPSGNAKQLGTSVVKNLRAAIGVAA